MKILYIAATREELLSFPGVEFAAKDSVSPLYLRGEKVSFLETGAGIPQTLNTLWRLECHRHYDAIVQAGYAGIYPLAGVRLAPEPGSPVWVRQDYFGDLGAENGSEFIPFSHMKLGDSGPFLFDETWNQRFPAELMKRVLLLPEVSGLTVNTCTGSAETARKRELLFTSQVESMEGAAAALFCETHSMPFLQVRFITNTASVRDRDSWKLKEAAEQMRNFFSGIASA